MTTPRWKKLNLPFNHRPEYPNYPAPPDLDDRLREELGTTPEEMVKEIWPIEPGIEYPGQHPDNIAFSQIRNKIVEKLSEEDKLFGQDFEDEVERRLRKSKDKRVIKAMKLKDFQCATDEWWEKQPEAIAYKATCDRLKLEVDERAAKKSFRGAGLCKAGVLMEVEEEGKTRHVLIGHINELGGLCDDCHMNDDVLVKRYKILWEE